MQKILVFCDGASKGNPGPGGWGTLVVYDGRVEELGSGEKHTTNNRMELTAALQGISHACAQRSDVVSVHTDSSYVINGAQKWAKGWQRNGWQTKQKTEVLNQDLWKELLRVIESCKAKIEWVLVGGHIGVAGNERVDEIASNFAEGVPVTLYAGSRAQYGIDVENISHDEEKKKAKSASRSRSGAKAYSYVSEVDGEVRVHKTWAECEARVRGKKARYKKALSASEEADIVRAFSR